MRRITLFATLFVAGCASTPAPPPQPEPVPVKPSPQLRGELIGLTAADLVQRLGTPALQVREGRSVKLQFRGASCVLDASGSSDDGGLSNLTFTWTNDAGRPLKTGTVVKYLYSVTYPNTFNVTLTAKDAAGMTALVTRPVAIR